MAGTRRGAACARDGSVWAATLDGLARVEDPGAARPRARMYTTRDGLFDGQDKVSESICNGACGYLLKKTPPARLLDSIREAHEGGAPMSPEIARKVITLFQRSGPPEKLDRHLTEAETRLLKLLSEGYSYQNSAGQMNISINTVRNYIRSIYDKLHINTKSEAVGKALRHGLIN